MRRVIYIILMLLFIAGNAFSQGYVDQKAIYPIVETQNGPIGNTEKVKWHVYDYKEHHKKDGKGVWTEFLDYIESLPGSHKGSRRYIIEMANRVTGENFKVGMKVLVPESFPDDYRAYSPYPFHYAAAAGLPKLFIIDKYTQTFGAYENGNLVRWGLVSTGQSNDLTPAGRYNFNWKSEYRQSSAAPEGEVWEMYWMYNFQAKWGLHVHQYALPIGYPVSHGCVRLTEADAKWNYNWANGWAMTGGKVKRNGTPVMVINNNPPGRPAQWAISGNGAVSKVKLPGDLYDVPPGLHSITSVAWASGW